MEHSPQGGLERVPSFKQKIAQPPNLSRLICSAYLKQCTKTERVQQQALQRQGEPQFAGKSMLFFVFAFSYFFLVDPQIKCEGLQLTTKNSIFLSAEVALDNSEF